MGWDDDEDDLDEDDLNEGEDVDDDATVPCPGCGEPVYDDAERCPRCGRYLSREESPTHHPWWIVVGAVLGLVGLLGWLLLR